MTLDTLHLALKTLQHINSVAHPVHTTVLPGELELAIESLYRAIEHHQPLCYYHPTSGRVRFDMPSSLSLGPSWIPLYKD